MAEAELVVTTGSGGGGGSGGEDEAVQGTRKLQEKIRAHESYAEKVKGAYNDLSKMYNQLRDDYAVFVTKHNEVTKSLETTRAEQDEKIAELEESLAEVKKVQAETEETLQKEIAQREGKIEEVNLELERDSEEIEKLRTELEGIQKTKQDLEEEKIDREGALATARDELQSVLRDLMRFASGTGGKDKENGVLESIEASGIEEIVNRISELRDAVSERVSVLGGLAVESEVKQMLNGGNEDVEELLSQLVKTKMELAESENKRLQTQLEIRKLRKEAAEN